MLDVDLVERLAPRLVHGDVRLVVEAVSPADASPWGVPAARFHVVAAPGRVGTVSLRDGHTHRITHLAGHVGFRVDAPFRGRGYAERAVRALLPLADAAGLRPLAFTTTPENAASRGTLEKLGCALVEAVPIPADYDSYARGERVKLRYVLAGPPRRG